MTDEEKQITKLRKAGYIPANAHVEITDPPFEPGHFPYQPGDPSRGYNLPAVADSISGGYEPTSDAAFLASLPLYRRLTGKVRQRFVAEALAFRATTEARLAFAAAIRPLTDACRKAGAGQDSPWMSRVKRFLTTDGPERWRACDECHGSGEADMFGPCQGCRGNGYKV